MERRTFIKAASIAASGILLSPLSSCGSGEEVMANPLSIAPGANGFELPALTFDTNALAPHIDQKTMEIHHGKHHAGYVKKLNKALEGTQFTTMKLEETLAKVTDEHTGIRNNGGGHYNHSLFWNTLTPFSKPPKGELVASFIAGFGSLDAFKEEFAKAAGTVFGSGWAWLSVDKMGDLFISQTPNQDNPLMANLVEKEGQPIMCLDVWEHAYYLNYQNRRKEYIDAYFNVVNWEQVEANLAVARNNIKD